MKFSWFHLMPYPDLPADFTARHRSVWVDPPARALYDPAAGARLYHDYLDELEHADALGFDGICVNEHHASAYGLMPSPNLMAAALARRTKRAKLVVLGNSVALYNPPVRVAEEFAMLDVLSGGRLVAGFPVGLPMDAAFAMGENPVTLREKHREGVELVTRAWAAEKPFAFNGRFTQLRYVNPWPRPLQRPGPPVWIPGGRSAETWDYCVEKDYLYANLSYSGHRAAKDALDGYWAIVERAGKPRNPCRAAYMQLFGVAESDAAAERLYKDAALYFYRSGLHVPPDFACPPGYMSEASTRRAMTSGTLVNAGALSWEELVAAGHVVVGSPATVVARIKELAATLNIGHLLTLLHFGNLSKEATFANTELFAREVIPAVRGLFSEHEDAWWPR